MKQLNSLSHSIIGCAMNVHRTLGPGLLESVYVDALCVEFEYARIKYARGKPVPIVYRGHTLAAPLKLDLIVRDEVIVEAKAVEALHPIHDAQLLTYLRLTNKNLGLLINFNSVLLKNGIHRKLLTSQQATLPVIKSHPETTHAVGDS